ncbi:MAG: hypothetical protein JO270_20360 [Acidobacteriaceae bacterium]|nr:hypothetical protein [Acidobacteriaceae bacterium]
MYPALKPMKLILRGVVVYSLLGAAAPLLPASEGPYFVTYTHQMEEQGNLDLENRSVLGQPQGGDLFGATAMELEYGLLGWWTTELYLDGQATAQQSAIFTGFRWENRFRLARREHWINPVLYVEFEDINGADKTLLEVVGHDSQQDFLIPNSVLRTVKQREIETKLLLGSNWRGWNFSENFIVEKNVAHFPWEFGYAVGVYRPLALEARPDRCNLCRENFRTGVEFYGGLGDTQSLTLRDTSHYVAPILEWTLSSGLALKVSPSFGTTDTSFPVLLRVGLSYEFTQFARRYHR